MGSIIQGWTSLGVGVCSIMRKRFMSQLQFFIFSSLLETRTRHLLKPQPNSHACPVLPCDKVGLAVCLSVFANGTSFLGILRRTCKSAHHLPWAMMEFSWFTPCLSLQTPPRQGILGWGSVSGPNVNPCGLIGVISSLSVYSMLQITLEETGRCAVIGYLLLGKMDVRDTSHVKMNTLCAS